MGRPLVIMLLCSVVGCSSSDPAMVGTAATDAAGGDGEDAQDDFGNVGSSGMPTGGSPGGTPGADPGIECIAETQTAKRVSVDMYVMLDRSGSMLEPTGAGPVKWDAIRDAITRFVANPQSDGLGVGLQYFPLRTPGVPDSCMQHNDCGMAGGPCLKAGCAPLGSIPSGYTPPPCLSDDDCQPTGSCIDLGVCDGEDTVGCFGPGSDACGSLGECVALPGGCLFWASCNVIDYETPAVEIAVLPDNGSALTDSLMAMTARGQTPTSAAIVGAIRRAGTRAAANPEHRVITVLATDGLPSDCLPIDADGVADLIDDGLDMDPQVRTYVIGVFAEGDATGQQNADRFASAGGTDEAFIVDPARDVAAQFLDALEEIRAGELECEFRLPEAPGAGTLDFGRVNVTLTEDDVISDMRYVETPGACDQATLGWYYDVPPGDDIDPSTIRVCDGTCDRLRDASGGRVDIRLGCETLRPD